MSNLEVFRDKEIHFGTRHISSYWVPLAAVQGGPVLILKDACSFAEALHIAGKHFRKAKRFTIATWHSEELPLLHGVNYKRLENGE